MRSITGLILLLIGFGVGAHAYYPDTFEKHVHLAKLSRSVAPVTVEHGVYSATPAVERSFSPGRQFYGSGERLKTGSIKTVVQPERPILTTTPKVVTRNGWNARVLTARSTDGSDRYGAGSKLSAPRDYYEMVRAVQTELRRVGCYDGRIDGSWGAGSKFAVREFMQLVNSALPTDKPDQFMLSLLRSYKGSGCNVQCQSGYTKSSHGRCLPYAITAQASPGPADKASNTPTRVPVARLVRRDGVMAEHTNVATKTRRARLPGMMAIGGPAPDRYSARQTAPGVATAPLITSSVPKPILRARPVHRPIAKRIYSKTRRASSSKTKRSWRGKAHRYKSASRKRARRRALMRQAFGEEF